MRERHGVAGTTEHWPEGRVAQKGERGGGTGAGLAGAGPPGSTPIRAAGCELRTAVWGT